MATEVLFSDDDDENFVPPEPPKRRRRQANDNKNADIEKWLDDHAVGYVYDQDTPIAAFDEDKSLKNQARLNPVEEAVIERYVTAWRNGAKFPPVVAHNLGGGPLIIVDGNHRLVSAKKAGVTNIDTYIIHKADPRNITTMTFEANVKHGWPTSDEERERHAMKLVQSGAKVAMAAKLMGVSANKVAHRVKRAEAENRVTGMGILLNDWDQLGNKIQVRLHTIAIDEVFKEAYLLTTKAGLNMTEVANLVRDITDAGGSMEKQMEVVKAARSAYQDRIDEAGGGMFARNRPVRGITPRMRFLASCGNLLSLPEPSIIAGQIEAPHEREDAIAKIDDTVKKLQLLRECLERA